jgi:hypothetical protein
LPLQSAEQFWQSSPSLVSHRPLPQTAPLDEPLMQSFGQLMQSSPDSQVPFSLHTEVTQAPSTQASPDGQFIGV